MIKTGDVLAVDFCSCSSAAASMSRREARDSHGKRLDSRSERDLSPKRSRRDSIRDSDGKKPDDRSKNTDGRNGEPTPYSRAKDNDPREESRLLEQKIKSDSVNRELKKTDGGFERTKHSYDDADLPRSRLNFQQRRYGLPNRPEERPWRHERRPAFREIKYPAPDPTSAPRPRGREWENQDGAEDRGWRGGEHRQQQWRRFDGGRNRERLASGGLGRAQPEAGQQEKWKHDLFDESNRSPTPKNEEDELAKLEALLSS
ncbi:cyclin-like protein isoform X2 [Wolffia australiana]